MEALRSSEMLVASYETTAWCHNSEDHNMNLHHYGNIKLTQYAITRHNWLICTVKCLKSLIQRYLLSLILWYIHLQVDWKTLLSALVGHTVRPDTTIQLYFENYFDSLFIKLSEVFNADNKNRYSILRFPCDCIKDACQRIMLNFFLKLPFFLLLLRVDLFPIYTCQYVKNLQSLLSSQSFLLNFTSSFLSSLYHLQPTTNIP